MRIQMRRILVTGSNGTIGTRLCEKLIESRYRVIGADRAKNRWNKDVDKLTITIDLRSKRDVLEKLPKDIDTVIHLAANASVCDLIADPGLALENLETLYNVLEFVRLNKIKQFIFASSREVYGNADIVCDEKCASVDSCESPYAASKLGGEALVRAYNKCYGLEFVMLRLSNVYGMYDDRDRLVPLFIKRSITGEDLYVYGREKMLDLIHIDDVVEGIIEGIKRFNHAKGESFNIAYGRGTSLLEIANLIKTHTNSSSKVVIKSNRIGEVVKCVPSIKKSKEVLGFSPKISVSEGIKRSVEWYIKSKGKT